MENLIIQVNRVLFDLSDEKMNREINKLKTYNILVSNCDEFLDDFLKSIMKIKRDWFQINRNKILGTCFVTIDLIFHGKEMDLEDNYLLNNIMKIIDDNIQKNRNTEDIIINLESENFNEEGFFIYFDENDSSVDVSYLELEKIFIDNNIEFKRVSLESNQFEGGSGSYIENALYFVISSMASGVLWDIIRPQIESLFRGIKEACFNKSERKDFLRIRKDVSEKTGIKEELLLVSQISKKENNNTKYVFKTPEKVIKVIVDDKCNIIDMEVDKI